MPKSLVAQSDGSVLLKDMKVSYYVTKVAKSKGVSKQPIFSTMLRGEAPGSTAKRKIYLDQLLDVSSEHVLRSFTPGTYLVRVGKEAAQTKLMPDHVKEICQFAVTKRRYLAHLLDNGGKPTV